MKKITLLLIAYHFSLFTISAQVWKWGRQGTSSSATMRNALVADKSGNVYVTGPFEDTISFGSFHLNSSAPTEVFLVKYDSSGNVKWAKQSHSTPTSNCFQSYLSLDDSGNVYLMGAYHDTVTFGTFTLNGISGTNNAFVAKYDANGNIKWAKAPVCASAVSNAIITSVAFDPKDNMLVTGDFSDTLTFGATALINSGTITTFLVQYNPAGNVVWASTSSAPSGYSTNEPIKVMVDAQGNAYVSGLYSDTLTFGAFTIINTYQGSTNDYLVKYDSSGNILWLAYTGTPSASSACYSNSAAIDSKGNVYITGNFSDTAIFGSDSINDSIYAAYIAKYDNSGNIVWVKHANNNTIGYSLAADSLDRLYFSSTLYNTDTAAFLGDTLITNAGLNPVFVMKLDTNGNVLCKNIIRTGGNANIACSKSGKYVYISGTLNDTITFNHDLLHGNDTSLSALFVSRWNPCYTAPNGIDEMAGDNYGVIVYPNPSHGTFTFQIKNEELKNKNIVEVYNMLGEKVYSKQLTKDSEQWTIDLSNQSSGIYLYRIITESGSLVSDGKLIIE